MKRDEPSETRPEAGIGGALRAHPIITAVILGCTLAGALLGLELLTESWSPLRRLLAGALAGAGTGLLLTATKMLG